MQCVNSDFEVLHIYHNLNQNLMPVNVNLLDIKIYTGKITPTV